MHTCTNYIVPPPVFINGVSPFYISDTDIYPLGTVSNLGKSLYINFNENQSLYSDCQKMCILNNPNLYYQRMCFKVCDRL